MLLRKQQNSHDGRRTVIIATELKLSSLLLFEIRIVNLEF